MSVAYIETNDMGLEARYVTMDTPSDLEDWIIYELHHSPNDDPTPTYLKYPTPIVEDFEDVSF
jgi:hypothetical protein